LEMCTAYKINGRETQELPYQMNGITIEPVLKNFAGWNTPTVHGREAAQLPEKMKTYISFINEYVGAPVKVVSNGPEREQIVHL
jgi:adenylosuccinate synthase